MSKHIANKIHFIRDIIDFGMVKVLKIHTTLNPADLLTKSLPGNAFEKNLVTMESLPERVLRYTSMVLLFGRLIRRST